MLAVTVCKSSPPGKNNHTSLVAEAHYAMYSVRELLTTWTFNAFVFFGRRHFPLKLDNL